MLMNTSGLPSAAVPSSVTSDLGVDDSVSASQRITRQSKQKTDKQLTACPKCNGNVVDTPSSRVKSVSGSTGKRRIKFSASAFQKDHPCSCKPRKINIQEKNAKSRLVHPVN